MAKVKSTDGIKRARYFQFYNGDWEKLAIFKDWLAPVPDNRHKAYCKYCKKEFRAHRTDLRTHARSRKHQKAGDIYFSSTTQKEGTVSRSRESIAETDRNVSSSDGWDEDNALEIIPITVLEPDEEPDDPPVITSDKSIVAAVTSSVPDKLVFPDTSNLSYSQIKLGTATGGITTQVLDLVRGIPVSRMTVTLLLECGSIWSKISDGTTDNEGRCSLLKTQEIVEGRYKMHFDVKKYFTLGLHDTFYPFIEVTFDVTDPSELYHVPLLLSPYGYMVYRGK